MASASASSPSSDAVLFNYRDEALLFEGDARLFKAPGWLNDRCINFYLRLLEHEEFPGRADILFVDPAVVSCMLIQCTDEEELAELGDGLGVAARSLVFVPVNDAEEFFSGCTHWSLLVYLAAARKFYHFDSSHGRNGPAALLTARKFWATLGQAGEPAVEACAACPQQENGYDCGMYVLCIAKYLAHLFVTEGSGGGGDLDVSGLASRVTQDGVAEARRRIGRRVRELAAEEEEQKQSKEG